MISRKIVVLGATGMLGQPVTTCLLEKGHHVRALVRSEEKARILFGHAVEIFGGSALKFKDVQRAIAGCDAVHINLTQESEYTATKHVIDLASDHTLERISFVSATTACEAHRWFPMIDVKMRTENLLRRSGFPYTVFCPTWVMETLGNFVHDNWAAVIIGRNPPPLHFFAAVDFGRMVAASYDDDHALGKRLFVHGPEAIPLPEALERFLKACHPEIRVLRLKLWQAKALAKLTGRKGLAFITSLIDYFDKVGEIGDPTEANALFGAPSITLDQWFKEAKDERKGMPH